VGESNKRKKRGAIGGTDRDGRGLVRYMKGKTNPGLCGSVVLPRGKRGVNRRRSPEHTHNSKRP